MSNEERPYIERCGFCGDGLLRFHRCSTCDEIIALCDECGLMWEDIEALSSDPNLPSDSSSPMCPSCGEREAEFGRVTVEEIDEKHLDRFSAGESV